MVWPQTRLSYTPLQSRQISDRKNGKRETETLYDAMIYVQVSFLYQVWRGHSLGHTHLDTHSLGHSPAIFFVFCDIYVLGMLLLGCCFACSYRLQ